MLTLTVLPQSALSNGTLFSFSVKFSQKEAFKKIFLQEVSEIWLYNYKKISIFECQTDFSLKTIIDKSEFELEDIRNPKRKSIALR